VSPQNRQERRFCLSLSHECPGSGLLVAQHQFRRITRYKQIPALIRELEALVPSKPAVVRERKAS
jgi:hypothetical protein